MFTKLSLVAALIVFAHAESIQEIDPIEPAFAADQPTVSFDSMFREMSQFSNFANWNALKAELEITRIRCSARERAIERAKRLNGTVSVETRERLEYDSKMCEAEAELLEKRVENAKASAGYDKFMLIQAGNPGADYRKELAGQLKRQIEFEDDQLRIQSRTAELTRLHQKSRLDRTRGLCEKRIIPQVECEQIADEYEAAVKRQRAIEAQRDINARSLSGVNRSIERLFEATGG